MSASAAGGAASGQEPDVSDAGAKPAPAGDIYAAVNKPPKKQKQKVGNDSEYANLPSEVQQVDDHVDL